MNVQKVGDCFGRATTESTFGCYAEILHHALRRLNTPPRTLYTIGVMHQSQVEFCLRMKLQVLERREIGIIAPVARNRHGNPVQRALEASSDTIGNIYQLRSVFRLHKMLVSSIAIAEMIPQFNISWHLISQPYKLLNNTRFDMRIVRECNTLQ